MVGWAIGVPLIAWLVLAPASLLGVSWVPSLTLLPSAEVSSPSLRATGEGPAVPTTLPPSTSEVGKQRSTGSGASASRPPATDVPATGLPSGTAPAQPARPI